MGDDHDPSFLDYIEEEDSAFFQELTSNLARKKKKDHDDAVMSYQPSSSSSSSSSSRPIEPTYHSFGSRLQIVPYQELQQSLAQNGVARISSNKKRKPDAPPPPPPRNPNMLNLQQASDKSLKKKPKPLPAPKKKQKQDDEKKHKLLTTPSEQLGPAAIKKKAAIAHEMVIEKGLALTQAQWMMKRYIERMRPGLNLPGRANQDFYERIRKENYEPDGLFYNAKSPDSPLSFHFEWYYYCQSPLTSKQMHVGPCAMGKEQCTHVTDHLYHCGSTSLDSENPKHICPSARFTFSHACGKRPVAMRNEWFDTLCSMLSLDEWNALQRTSHAAQAIYHDRSYGLAMKPYRELLQTPLVEPAVRVHFGRLLHMALSYFQQPLFRFSCFIDRLFLQSIPASQRRSVWTKLHSAMSDDTTVADPDRVLFLRLSRAQASTRLGSCVYQLDPPVVAYMRSLVLWTVHCTSQAENQVSPDRIMRIRGKLSPATPPMFDTAGAHFHLPFVEWFASMEESVEVNKALAGLRFSCGFVRIDPTHVNHMPMLYLFDAYCHAAIDLSHGILYSSVANFQLHLFFRKCMKFMDDWKETVSKKKKGSAPPGVDASSAVDFLAILKAEMHAVYPTAKANQLAPAARHQPVLSFGDDWSATLNHLRDDTKRTAPSALVQSMLCEVAHIVFAYL